MDHETVDDFYRKHIGTSKLGVSSRFPIILLVFDMNAKFNAITKPVLYGYLLFIARKRSLGQGNIFSSVCQEFCPQVGVCLSAYWDTTHPPPGPPNPLQQTPPRSRHPAGADIPQRRHPPDQESPGPGTPCAVHAGRYGQQAGGMHPTGMQSCSLLILAFHIAQRQIFTQIPVGLRVN